MLTADKVLVTIGTVCSMSGVGSTETYLARVANARDFIAFAAFDAGLIDIEPRPDGSLNLRWRNASGSQATLEQIEASHGAQLRANLGIRYIPELSARAPAIITEIAAGLPHTLASGGLRELAGLRFRDVRDSGLRDMYGLFDDDPRLGPSLQAQLFVYAGMGALAALPTALSELLPNPYDFRVVGATAFAGLDALHEWRGAGNSELANDKLRDRFAMRLASGLSSHGPALISAMLAPSYPLSKSLRNPALLESLKGTQGFRRVPQTPLNTTGACAASSIAFCELAPQMLLDYPGFQRPRLTLWTAADAATRPDWGILDAFGTGAMMTRQKLEALNATRAADAQRPVRDCLAPFDVDANGTVVGDGGSALLVTTLDFALRNFLDITSIIVGWGQSGEAGGKAHFAGVGFGGENALLHCYEMAHRGHGYGVGDFHYFAAHATGTRTNSKTDLTTAFNARVSATELQGIQHRLQPLTIGTPKALGDGHTMGETGLKAVSQALQFVLGQGAVGIPTLRTPDPDLGDIAESFVLSPATAAGNPDGGAMCATQGFGGYNGAIALRSAHPAALQRYQVDQMLLNAYLERWPQLRREREQRERHWRLRRQAALELAQIHHWRGLE